MSLPPGEDAAAWDRAWAEVRGSAELGADAPRIAIEHDSRGWRVVVQRGQGARRQAPIPAPQQHEDRVDALFLALALFRTEQEAGLAWPEAVQPEPIQLELQLPPQLDTRSWAVQAPLPAPDPPPPPEVGAVDPPRPELGYPRHSGGGRAVIAQEIPETDLPWEARGAVDPIELVEVLLDEASLGTAPGLRPWIELGGGTHHRAGQRWSPWLWLHAGLHLRRMRAGLGIEGHPATELDLGEGRSLSSVGGLALLWLRPWGPVELGLLGGLEQRSYTWNGPVARVPVGWLGPGLRIGLGRYVGLSARAALDTRRTELQLGDLQVPRNPLAWSLAISAGLFPQR